MINRELIRIKVVQLTYAYYQDKGKNMDTAEKELLFSLTKGYHLYNYLLLLIVAITKEERSRYEVALQRAVREDSEKPSDKFVNNRFALQLEENEQLQKFVEDTKNTWQDDKEFVRSLCDMVEQCDVYKNYISLDETNYETDREFWRALYKVVVKDNEALEALLEEKSLYWNDDKEIVDTFVLKTIKRFEEQNGAQQELLPEFKDADSRSYAIDLFRATIQNAEEYHNYMKTFSKNWDFNRLAYMDIVIMQIAIAELVTFPEIPVSVTINEYVELAKLYSTPRSGSYINGMLDNIAHKLYDEGKILKRVKN